MIGEDGLAELMDVDARVRQASAKEPIAITARATEHSLDIVVVLPGGMIPRYASYEQSVNSSAIPETAEDRFGIDLPNAAKRSCVHSVERAPTMSGSCSATNCAHTLVEVDSGALAYAPTCVRHKLEILDQIGAGAQRNLRIQEREHLEQK
jgi:hypothetical protein